MKINKKQLIFSFIAFIYAIDQLINYYFINGCLIGLNGHGFCGSNGEYYSYLYMIMTVVFGYFVVTSFKRTPTG